MEICMSAGNVRDIQSNRTSRKMNTFNICMVIALVCLIYTLYRLVSDAWKAGKASVEIIDAEARIRSEIEMRNDFAYVSGEGTPEQLKQKYIAEGLRRALYILHFCNNINNSPCKPRK